MTSRLSYSFGEAGRGLVPPAPGKPLIVHVVLNVEHWPFDATMPRKLLGSPHGKDSIPDVPNYSWSEYGMRRGLPRLVDALRARALPASISFNAAVIDAYPAAAEVLRDTGWEFIGHGAHQQALTAVADEEAVVRTCLDMIEDFCGTRPTGWLGPGLQETMRTPDLLSACGIEYTCDWVIDDVPVWLHAEPSPIVALPYSLELNDSVIFATEKHTADELLIRARRTIDVLAAESVDEPRVFILPLHGHMLGVPHRIGVLTQILDDLCGRDDVVFMTGSEICRWFVEQSPSGSAEPGRASSGL